MNIGEVFDDLQQEYHDKMNRWVPFYQTLSNHFKEAPEPDFQVEQALDLGAGDGNVTASLLTNYPNANYLLVDASRQMLDHVEQRFRDAKIKTTQTLMQDLQLADHTFDLIAASFSLHHLKEEDKKAIIHSVHRWLHPGGYFYYADLFTSKSDSEHASFLKYWESFVRRGHVEGDWEYLINHYQTYDFPNNLATQLEWLRHLEFQQIRVFIYEKYWVFIAAKK